LFASLLLLAAMPLNGFGSLISCAPVHTNRSTTNTHA
jgi:hypothetical protein